jgi:hypothetical protein
MSWNALLERTMPPRFTGRPQAAKPTPLPPLAASRENNAQDAADRGFFPTEPYDNPLHPASKNACAVDRCGSRLA